MHLKNNQIYMLGFSVAVLILVGTMFLFFYDSQVVKRNNNYPGLKSSPLSEEKVQQLFDDCKVNVVSTVHSKPYTALTLTDGRSFDIVNVDNLQELIDNSSKRCDHEVVHFIE